MEFNLHKFIIFKLKMNNFEIDDIDGYDDMMIRIDYNKIKASMISKIDEYLSRGIDSVCQPMNQLIIKSEPTRKISLDEYRRRQQLKLCNLSEILQDSSMKSNSKVIENNIEVQVNETKVNAASSNESYNRRKEQCRINSLKYRQRKRFNKVLKP